MLPNYQFLLFKRKAYVFNPILEVKFNPTQKNPFEQLFR